MKSEAFFEVIRSRRSVRRYADRGVAKEEIEGLIEAAVWAPSNHNRQPWRFVVFQDRGELRELAGRVRRSLAKALEGAPRLLVEQQEEILDQGSAFADAPAVLLAMHKRRPLITRSLIEGATSELASGEALSTAMAVENLLLAAHVMGLGACVMTAPLLAGEVWRSIAGLPEGFEPTCLVAVGYPEEEPETVRRRSVGSVVLYR
ncbi:MAG: nitroreductase family protein [Planctomycetota bacterium]